jgi:hypothetical protein
MLTENRDIFDLQAERLIACPLPLSIPKFEILQLRKHKSDDTTLQIIAVKYELVEYRSDTDIDGHWEYHVWDVDLGVEMSMTEDEMVINTSDY